MPKLKKIRVEYENEITTVLASFQKRASVRLVDYSIVQDLVRYATKKLSGVLPKHLWRFFRFTYCEGIGCQSYNRSNITSSSTITIQCNKKGEFFLTSYGRVKINAASKESGYKTDYNICTEPKAIKEIQEALIENFLND